MFKHTEALEQVTDQVAILGVKFLTGPADGSELTLTSYAQWMRSDLDENPEVVTRVEEYIETTRAAVAGAQL